MDAARIEIHQSLESTFPVIDPITSSGLKILVDQLRNTSVDDVEASEDLYVEMTNIQVPLMQACSQLSVRHTAKPFIEKLKNLTDLTKNAHDLLKRFTISGYDYNMKSRPQLVNPYEEIDTPLASFFNAQISVFRVVRVKYLIGLVCCLANHDLVHFAAERHLARLTSVFNHFAVMANLTKFDSGPEPKPRKIVSSSSSSFEVPAASSDVTSSAPKRARYTTLDNLSIWTYSIGDQFDEDINDEQDSDADALHLREHSYEDMKIVRYEADIFYHSKRPYSVLDNDKQGIYNDETNAIGKQRIQSLKRECGEFGDDDEEEEDEEKEDEEEEEEEENEEDEE